jgi:dTDP-4-dehydrorhamnose 3,5-epimerase
MNILKTTLPGLLLIEPDVHGDDRGYFMETWRSERYAEFGLPGQFVQDNLSLSAQGVLRGLHCQHPHDQGKLVTVLQGEVFDVVVDVRHGSPTFGHWEGVSLNGATRHQFYIPAGYAHGFCVISETALFIYKCTDYYQPETEFGIAWDDPDIAIDWPIDSPLLSEKDGQAPRLRDIPVERLPVYSP